MKVESILTFLCVGFIYIFLAVDMPQDVWKSRN